MTQSCFTNWLVWTSFALKDKGVALANAQAYNTSKVKCLQRELILATFIFEVIKCYCFYTEAELAADTTLDDSDKTNSITDDEINTILNKLKKLLENGCNC